MLTINMQKGLLDLLRISDSNNVPARTQKSQRFNHLDGEDGNDDCTPTLSRSKISSVRLRQASHPRTNNGTKHCAKLAFINPINHFR